MRHRDRPALRKDDPGGSEPEGAAHEMSCKRHQEAYVYDLGEKRPVASPVPDYDTEPVRCTHEGVDDKEGDKKDQYEHPERKPGRFRSVAKEPWQKDSVVDLLKETLVPYDRDGTPGGDDTYKYRQCDRKSGRGEKAPDTSHRLTAAKSGKMYKEGSITTSSTCQQVPYTGRNTRRITAPLARHYKPDPFGRRTPVS